MSYLEEVDVTAQPRYLDFVRSVIPYLRLLSLNECAVVQKRKWAFLSPRGVLCSVSDLGLHSHSLLLPFFTLSLPGLEATKYYMGTFRESYKRSALDTNAVQCIVQNQAH